MSSKPDTESIVEQRRATHLTTWTRFHLQLNPDEAVLPLKVDSRLTIVKTMRECGYKSTRNYLATMKRAHMKETGRGRGPSQWRTGTQQEQPSGNSARQRRQSPSQLEEWYQPTGPVPG